MSGPPFPHLKMNVPEPTFRINNKLQRPIVHDEDFKMTFKWMPHPSMMWDLPNTGRFLVSFSFSHPFHGWFVVLFAPNLQQSAFHGYEEGLCAWSTKVVKWMKNVPLQWVLYTWIQIFHAWMIPYNTQCSNKHSMRKVRGLFPINIFLNIYCHI